MLVLFAGLQSVPDDISEAAVMDGASRFQRFVHITLPYLTSLIVLVLIIRLSTRCACSRRCSFSRGAVRRVRPTSSVWKCTGLRSGSTTSAKPLPWP
ncbi:ABC transporter permease subunit [Halalkalicoccus salilacus]|uniref:ABC transporter permease subunit n=1 Tax=Halalkalicoccus sp. GCM10025704 TaxID=3252662 RepID=UPI0036239E1A